MNEIVPAHNIGAYVPMIDGPEKVSGRAKYTADIMQPGQCWRGASIAAPIRTARSSRSTSRRRSSCRACAPIVTGADCDKTFGVLPIARSEHPLARDRVRYRGEPVAAVAADRRCHRARGAAPHQVQGARTAGLLHRQGRARARRRRAARARSPAISNATCCSNWAASSRASREADLVREGTYNCAEVCQNQMEMHAAIAEYDAVRERMTVHASTQVPYYVHLMLSQILGMEMSRIRVIKPHVGGGFGCRTETLNDRTDRGAAGAQVQRHRAAGDHARGDLHHPSRPAGDRHQAQDRHAQGRPHHRGRMRMRPARRRAFRLRRGDDPLCRLDALRHLRPAQRQISRPARADQHAALRRLPRPRHRRHPLRVRKPGRRDGGRTRARSVRGAARQSAQRADLHRQRPDGELLRTARVSRLGGEGKRLGASARASCRTAARAWAWPARTTSAAPPSR